LPVGAKRPPYDVHAPYFDSLWLLQLTPDTIPATIPYVFGDSALEERWRQELSRVPGFKVGIAWQAQPRGTTDVQRSMPLTAFAPLAAVPGVTLISLQNGPGSEQLRELGGRFPVIDPATRPEGEPGSFMDTAAVMKILDLVVSVDSSPCHLAGALGVPVWTALPFYPDWRWMLGRDDTPWYPTMRLFRQERAGDWPGVFRRIAEALGGLVRERGGA